MFYKHGFLNYGKKGNTWNQARPNLLTSTRLKKAGKTFLKKVDSLLKI